MHNSRLSGWYSKLVCLFLFSSFFIQTNVNGQQDSYLDTTELAKQQNDFNYTYYFTGELYEIDRKKSSLEFSERTYFYRNGNIKSEIYRDREYTYSEHSKDMLIQLSKKNNYTGPIVFDYENGKIRAKTSSKSTNYKTKKIPYSISRGQFIDQKLLDGEISFYNTSDELVVSKKVQNGVEQEGLYYQGKRYNLTDSLNQREGKWLIIKEARVYSSNRVAKENCFERIMGITNYHANVQVDTSYVFFDSGEVKSIFISSNGVAAPRGYLYYKNGNIEKTNFFKKDVNGLYRTHKSIYYSDTLIGCMLKRETYSPTNYKIDYTYEYRDCKVYSKTALKEDYSHYENTQTITHSMTIVDEGETREITYEEELMFIPILEPIPYTVEIGVFDTSETDLLNGKIFFYSETNQLLETKEVLNGEILK